MVSLEQDVLNSLTVARRKYVKPGDEVTDEVRIRTSPLVPHWTLALSFHPYTQSSIAMRRSGLTLQGKMVRRARGAVYKQGAFT